MMANEGQLDRIRKALECLYNLSGNDVKIEYFQDCSESIRIVFACEFKK
jgi:hypothetical protein